MRSIEHFLAEMDETVRRRGTDGRARVLARVTDHLVEGAGRRSLDERSVLDQLMQRLVRAAELATRAEIAARLAPLETSPPGLIGVLALDEIVVARPVLALSPVLTDQRLLDVVLMRGRDHHLAICERPVLSASVGDLLVSRGDGFVRIALAANGGARLSAAATATLLQLSRDDEALGQELARRADLAPRDRSRLGEAARTAAARRLAEALPDLDLEALAALREPDPGPPAETVALRRYGNALAALHGSASRPIGEADLARAAAEGDLDRTIAAMSALTGLSLQGIERVMSDPASNVPIVLGRARGWSWATVKALLRLRDPHPAGPHHFREAQLLYMDISPRKAERILAALKPRDTAERNPLDV